MKNRNLAKILTLVLSLALLIGSVAAINVSAEETKPIAAMTIVHGEKVQLAIKLNSTDANATVNYYWGDDSSNVKTATYNAAESAKANAAIYVTEGVAYYELGKVATITVGEQTITYSVAQFLFAKIYRDKVGGDAQVCYEALLALGDASQIHLSKQDSSISATALPSKSTYAYTNDANITINGDNYAFAPSGEALYVDLAYTGDASYTGFKVGDNLIVKAGKKAKILGACEISLYDGVINEYNYDFQSDVTSGITLYTLDNLTDKNLVKQSTITTTDNVASYYGYAGQLILDPADGANYVLQILANDGCQNSKTTSTVNTISTITLSPLDSAENGKVHVIEFDFNLVRFQKQSGATQAEPFSLYAYDKDGNKLGKIGNKGSEAKYSGFICLDSVTNEATPDMTNNYHFLNNTVRTNDTEPSDYAMFDAGKWYRFRVVWNQESKDLRIDVSFDNGATWYKAFNGARATAEMTGDVAYVAFEFEQVYQMAMEYRFDNMVYNVVTTAPAAPTVLGNDAAEYPAE